MYHTKILWRKFYDISQCETSSSAEIRPPRSLKRLHETTQGRFNAYIRCDRVDPRNKASIAAQILSSESTRWPRLFSSLLTPAISAPRRLNCLMVKSATDALFIRYVWRKLTTRKRITVAFGFRYDNAGHFSILNALWNEISKGFSSMNNGSRDIIHERDYNSTNAQLGL